MRPRQLWVRAAARKNGRLSCPNKAIARCGRHRAFRLVLRPALDAQSGCCNIKMLIRLTRSGSLEEIQGSRSRTFRGRLPISPGSRRKSPEDYRGHCERRSPAGRFVGYGIGVLDSRSGSAPEPSCSRGSLYKSWFFTSHSGSHRPASNHRSMNDPLIPLSLIVLASLTHAARISGISSGWICVLAATSRS
jgi:hypothetical protein